jgi:hypothetical protein
VSNTSSSASDIESTKNEVTVADYIEHLKTIPQDYVLYILMQNSEHYYYEYLTMTFPITCTLVVADERRVYLTNTGA